MPTDSHGDDQEHESQMIHDLMRNIHLESPATESMGGPQFPSSINVLHDGRPPRSADWMRVSAPAQRTVPPDGNRIPRPLSAELLAAANAGPGGVVDLQRAATPTAQTSAFSDSPHGQPSQQSIVLLPRTNIPPHMQEQFTSTPPKGDRRRGSSPTHSGLGYADEGHGVHPHEAVSHHMRHFMGHGHPPLPPPPPPGPGGIPWDPAEYMHYCKMIEGGMVPEGCTPMDVPYDPAFLEYAHMHGIPPFPPYLHPHPAYMHLHHHPHLGMHGLYPQPGPARARGMPGEPGRGALAGIWELSDLRGRVVEFSRDQEGSRFIQKQISLGTSDDERAMLFDEAIPCVYELMTDVFGNYVVQKLLEHGSPAQMEKILNAFRGHILSLSLQTYGCRVVQKALEVMRAPFEDIVVDELRHSVPRCVQDQNGNHVIQKCIETMPEKVGFIVRAFQGMVQHLATHAYGCRVIQRLLEHCNHLDVIHPILDEILVHARMLVKDQYGNYVVQDLLVHGDSSYRRRVGESLCGSLMDLSLHKFASNAVEKLFQYGSTDDRYKILEELMTTMGPDGYSALLCMVKDQFANYVVQKLLDMSDDAQRMSIIEHIRPHSAMLRQYNYGKHIVSRIERSLSGAARHDGVAPVGGLQGVHRPPHCAGMPHNNGLRVPPSQYHAPMEMPMAYAGDRT